MRGATRRLNCGERTLHENGPAHPSAGPSIRCAVVERVAPLLESVAQAAPDGRAEDVVTATRFTFDVSGPVISEVGAELGIAQTEGLALVRGHQRSPYERVAGDDHVL